MWSPKPIDELAADASHSAEVVELRPEQFRARVDQPHIRPAHSHPVRSRWAALIGRELTYWLLTHLQGFCRWLVTVNAYNFLSDLGFRERYRRAQRLIARRYLLIESASAIDGSLRQAGRTEVSRRVFSLAGSGQGIGKGDVRLICHVSTWGPKEAERRLLDRFVESALRQGHGNQLDDDELGATLNLYFQWRIGSRWYCEVLIHPQDRAKREDRRADAAATPDERAHVGRPGAALAAAGLTADDLGAVRARSDADWAFATEQVQLAIEQGRRLDDAFIDDLARRRLRRARASYQYDAERGARPTLETSTRIVRAIVKLHEVRDVPLDVE